MRVLFVRLSSFGDVVFALPAAKALNTALPGARLAWAIEGPLAPLLEGAPYVDEILVANTRGWRTDLLGRGTREEISDFLRRGRGLGADLVVDAQGLFKSALITALVPAPRKVGFGWASATEKINCLFTDEQVDVDRAARPHVLDQMLALAEHVTGKTGFERTPDVKHLVEKKDEIVDAWLEQHGQRPFAVLQPFSSKVNKEWGADDVVAFAERLSADGIQPVLRWGPGEESRANALITLSKKIFSSSPPLRANSSSSSSSLLLLAPAKVLFFLPLLFFPSPPRRRRLLARASRRAQRCSSGRTRARRTSRRRPECRRSRSSGRRPPSVLGRSGPERRSSGNSPRTTIVPARGGPPMPFMKPRAAFGRREFLGVVAGVLVYAALGAAGNAEKGPTLSAARESLSHDKLYPVPFGSGETLVYTIAWLKIEGGEMTLRTARETTSDGVPVHRMTLVATSNDYVSKFYPVRDLYETWVDARDFQPLRFEKHAREGRYESDEVEEFDLARRIGSWREDRTPLPERVQDIISSFYYLRAQPLAIGQDVRVDMFSRGKVYKLKAAVLEKERVETEAGVFDAFKLQPQLRENETDEDRNRGKLFIWFSDDERRLPVMAKTVMPIGSVTARLRKIVPGTKTPLPATPPAPPEGAGTRSAAPSAP